jgi:hypothetical protein
MDGHAVARDGGQVLNGRKNVRKEGRALPALSPAWSSEIISISGQTDAS